MWTHERAVYDQVWKSQLGNFSIGFRAAVAVELPGVADFADQVQVQIAHDDVIRVARAGRQDAAAGVAEITLPVELADAPGFFPARPVDGTDEVAVGYSMRGL